MDWIDNIITDEVIFPPVDDIPFPRWPASLFLIQIILIFSNFRQICDKIFRRLYRIFVHVYIEHFERYYYIPFFTLFFYTTV